MRTKLIRSAILAVAATAAAAVALMATLGASARPSGEAAFAKGRSLAADATFSHGKLEYPAEIASQLGDLNDALDACYVAHGAARVNLASGGWTYDDPAGSAAAACQSAQAAVTAYADGPEMAGFTQAVRPLVHAFWSCMLARGAVPPNADDVRVDTTTAAFSAAADACSTAADGAAGVAGS